MGLETNEGGSRTLLSMKGPNLVGVRYRDASLLTFAGC